MVTSFLEHFKVDSQRSTGRTLMGGAYNDREPDPRQCRPGVFTGVVLLFLFLSCALGIGAETVGCPKRVVHIRITERQIAEIEEGAAHGHQPWRSDSHTVADVALAQVEPGIDHRADSIPFKRTIVSPAHQLFRFELIGSHHIDEISVRRLRWHNPRTGKTELTGAWWATEAVVSDCAIPERK